ncbi:hypothetical protein BDW74DRAFT_183083 [Aspergillus multicolor]|uniref:uncharacterized protein n=1 Tax=Aspergillus multicolor TaxID=41759 RepID=UPI003CCCB8F2
MDPSDTEQRARRRNIEPASSNSEDDTQAHRPPPAQSTSNLNPNSDSDTAQDATARPENAAAWRRFDRAFADAHANDPIIRYLFLPVHRGNPSRILLFTILANLIYFYLCKSIAR